MSWKCHGHFLFLFSGQRLVSAKPWTANPCNARDDCVQTSLTLIFVAVPGNTNGFSHLYTNPPVISPLWRSLPALPLLTTGRRSVGQRRQYHASLLGSTFGPCIRGLKCVKMGTFLQSTRAQSLRKKFLNNRWQRGMTEPRTRSYLLVRRLRNWDIWVTFCTRLNVIRKTR